MANPRERVFIPGTKVDIMKVNSNKDFVMDKENSFKPTATSIQVNFS